MTPSFGTADGTHALEAFWSQAGYNGTRSYRGAEFVSNLSPIVKEGWEGFSLYVPSVGYPHDKSATIAQVFDTGGSTQGASWCSMLEIRNNDLWIEHRGNVATPADHVAKVMSDLPLDHWVRIVLHFAASHVGKGEVQVWVDNDRQSDPTYSASNINFAYGNWDSGTDALTGTSSLGLKLGMYNWDTGNYLTGETRTLYYDDIHQLIGGGSGGFATVNAFPEPTGLVVISVLGIHALRRRRCGIRLNGSKRAENTIYAGETRLDLAAI